MIASQNQRESTSHRRGPRRPARRNRGMAILVVLMLVAMTLAFSYAMMRGQSTTAAIQANAAIKGSARQAAQAGMAAAMRKMSLADWAGADTSFTGKLSNSESFHVTYSTGDAALTSASADYAEFPFRVTVTCVGTATDAADSRKTSSYTIRTVMQLIRRKISADPANWNTLTGYTVYQWGDNSAVIQSPCRVEGNVLLQGTMSVCGSAPNSSGAYTRYLTDLNAMQTAGLADWRPFGGTVSTPNSRNGTLVTNVLQGLLNTPTVNITASSAEPLATITTPTSYRLYPGGKRYAIPSLNSLYGSRLQDQTVQGDLPTNPLGIFRASSSLEIRSNVTVIGTILTPSSDGDLEVTGQNVQMRPVNLPLLNDGSPASTVQLPVAYCGNDFNFYSQSSSSIRGLCYVRNHFEAKEGDASTTCDYQGKVLTKKFRIRPRSSWLKDNDVWANYLADFLWDLSNPPMGQSPILYFPQWLKEKKGLSSQPLLTVKPDSGGVVYHWQDWTQPIYVAHPNDDGLRWDLVRWEDGVQ